jgi:N-acyl homoserine lactone hydrolase
VSANGLRVYVLCGGLLELDLALMLPDRAPGSRWTVPVPAFLVVHRRGRLLFDTGVHCAAIADPVGRLGETRASRFGMRSQPGDEVVSQLGLLGLRPDDVTWVANSHLHFDHCGGNELLGDVPILVQRAEWEAAHAERPSGYLSADFDTGQDVRLVDGEHDVFGDGTVVCIPTPGHTAGHQSLRVRTTDREVVLTADACYFRETLTTSRLPPFAHDHAEQLKSLDILRAFEAAGAHLVFGHDASQIPDDAIRSL